MKKILLVDNDAMFTGMVSYLLEKEQFHVSIAKDGKEAASALAAGHYDLVISDMFMPYSNGFELLNDVRKNKVNPYTPVMVVSDVSNELSIANCFRLGADAYLTKPVNVPGFLSEIKNLVIQQENVAA
ncbi:MAG: response regulator [Bacteroidota bacterium]